MPRSKERFKSTAIVSGACPVHSYGSLESVRRKGVEWMTMFEPGVCSLVPKRVDIFRHVRTVDGNTAEWEWVESIPFRLVPRDEWSCIKRRKERI